MRLVVGLVLITGCNWDPTTTGANGMVGQILDANGRPAVGVQVESIEAKKRTDLAGFFAVQYKDPDQYVHFELRDVWYRRTFQPEDEGKSLIVTLPETTPGVIDCGDWTGSVRVDWQLEDAFLGRIRGTCEPDKLLPIGGIPAGEPVAYHRAAGQTTWSEIGSKRVAEDRLSLLPPSRKLRVQLEVDGARSPASCALWVDGEATGQPGPPAEWLVEVVGTPPVWAVCDGRPGVPVQGGGDAVTVGWAAKGPSIDPLEPLKANWLGIRGAEWTQLVHSGEDGFALPNLPRGTYQLWLGADATPPTSTDFPQAADPGVLRLTGDGPYLGTLTVDAPLADGPVVVERIP